MANSAVHTSEKLVCKSLFELNSVAKRIISFAQNYRVWIFSGEMGAGKTTLIKALCKEMGVIDNVSSPTFSLVNEYLTNESRTLYHFDFYRIKDEAEALDIGVDDYFYSDDLCMIEWPSKIEQLIPERHMEVKIQVVPSEERFIELIKYD